MSSITQLNSLDNWFSNMLDYIIEGEGPQEQDPWDDWLEVLDHYAAIDDNIQDMDSHLKNTLKRYMSGMARRIQFCWWNREEQPMACPCPELP
tara:strand:- start:652 stop:930 length:279 start_codon:yes stop_codon:yes gene_type:complete